MPCHKGTSYAKGSMPLHILRPHFFEKPINNKVNSSYYIEVKQGAIL